MLAFLGIAAMLMRGREWSVRVQAFLSIRAVRLLLGARAVSTYETTNGKQRALGKFSASRNLSFIRRDHCVAPSNLTGTSKLQNRTIAACAKLDNTWSPGPDRRLTNHSSTSSYALYDIGSRELRVEVQSIKERPNSFYPHYEKNLYVKVSSLKNFENTIKRALIKFLRAIRAKAKFCEDL